MKNFYLVTSNGHGLVGAHYYAFGMGALFLATLSGMITQRAEAQASAATTTTTLAITSAGGAVTPVESGSVVTLTAVVKTVNVAETQ